MQQRPVRTDKGCRQGALWPCSAAMNELLTRLCHRGRMKAHHCKSSLPTAFVRQSCSGMRWSKPYAHFLLTKCKFMNASQGSCPNAISHRRKWQAPLLFQRVKTACARPSREQQIRMNSADDNGTEPLYNAEGFRKPLAQWQPPAGPVRLCNRRSPAGNTLCLWASANRSSGATGNHK